MSHLGVVATYEPQRVPSARDITAHPMAQLRALVVVYFIDFTLVLKKKKHLCGDGILELLDTHTR